MYKTKSDPVSFLIIPVLSFREVDSVTRCLNMVYISIKYLESYFQLLLVHGWPSVFKFRAIESCE